MRILNRSDIMETIGMLTDENLDVRTVTMGISLLDCIDPDGEKATRSPAWRAALSPPWTASAASTVFPS